MINKFLLNLIKSRFIENINDKKKLMILLMLKIHKLTYWMK